MIDVQPEIDMKNLYRKCETSVLIDIWNGCLHFLPIPYEMRKDTNVKQFPIVLKGRSTLL